MTFGAEIWGPPLINAVASIGSGLLSGSGVPKETKTQRTQRKLIDDLLLSLNGKGSYNDLFSRDEDAFNKSYVEPANARFNNQIAPQIQQQYIASGQQRGTGLDDQLLRAGVDLDQLLNEQYFNFQQSADNRKQNAINSILGMGSGAPVQPSTGQNIANATGGFLSSQGFADSVNNIFKNSNTPQTTAPPNPTFAPPTRKGFTPDWMDYQLGDKRWGNN